MPRDNPGRLSARGYVDVIAYILNANKIPSGSSELAGSAERLRAIVIERKPTP